MINITDIKTYLNDASKRSFFVEKLFELLRCQTVSADPKYGKNMDDCAQRLATFGREYLAMHTEVIPTDGNPCVIMRGCEIPNAPRVLIYGHYDVQPAEDVELWESPPFEPYIEGEVLHGRGSSDDKGQFFIWLSALKVLRDLSGEYPLNVSVILEGEEEIGSVHFEEVLRERATELKSDLVIVSDTSSVVRGIPVLHYSLRGLVCFEINLRTANGDLHSGVHGGVSPNAARELSLLISKLYDEYGRVTVPGFYDDVLPIAGWEKERLAQIPFDAREYSEQLGAVLCGEEGFSTNERRWFRPTLECNGMYSGYIGAGGKTIVPATACAKFSARLVACQRPAEIMKLIRQWFRDNTTERFKLEFIEQETSEPYLLKQDGVGMQLFEIVQETVSEAFKCSPLVSRNGGAIGVVSLLDKILHAPTLLLGFGSPDDRIHAPNEKFEMSNFWNGIVAGVALLDKVSERLH